MKSALADLLCGFLTLGIVMTGFITGVLANDLRILAMVAAVLFLAAGAIRGAFSSSPRWLTGIRLNLGSTVPVIVMAKTDVAFTSTPHLAVFLAVSLFAALAGAETGHCWRLSRRAASLAILAITVVLAASAALFAVPRLLESRSTAHIQRPAAPFTLLAANGAPITADSLRGRVVVLAFWATWCPPCREELPRLDALYNRYKDRSDVAFLAVGVDDEDDVALSAEKGKPFFEKRRLSLPLAFGDGRTKQQLHVDTLPTLLILDSQGDVRLVHTGYDGAEDLERIVNAKIDALHPAL